MKKPIILLLLLSIITACLCSCSLFNTLSGKIELTAENLPIELNCKKHDGSIESTIKVEEITYDYNIFKCLNIRIYGEKTSGKNSIYDIISYKLYDIEGYMIDAGNVILRFLEEGDKFKEDISLYNIEPNKTYILKFSEYEW